MAQCAHEDGGDSSMSDEEYEDSSSGEVIPTTPLAIPGLTATLSYMRDTAPLYHQPLK